MSKCQKRRATLKKLLFSHYKEASKTNFSNWNSTTLINKEIQSNRTNKTITLNTNETSSNKKILKSFHTANSFALIEEPKNNKKNDIKRKYQIKDYIANVIALGKGINNINIDNAYKNIIHNKKNLNYMRSNLLIEVKRQQLLLQREKIKQINEEKTKILPNIKVTKENAILKQLLNIELKSNLMHNFQLVPPPNFSSKFRLHEQKAITNFDEMNQKTIEEVIDKNLCTKNIVFETLKLINREKKMSRNHLILQKIKRVLIRAAIDFKRLNISPTEFYTKYNVTVPYSNTESHSLLNAVKNKNTDLIYKLIKENKYLLLDFDDVRHICI